MKVTVADLRQAIKDLPDEMVVNALEPGQAGRSARGFHVTGFEEIQSGHGAPKFTVEVQPNNPA